MLATIAALTLLALVDPQGGREPPTEEELAAITERGRNLAGYDVAAWHASDALRAKGPKEGSFVRYIARRTDQGWMVAFGKMNQAQDKFLIAYEATQAKKPDEYEVKEFDTPKEDDGFFR